MLSCSADVWNGRPDCVWLLPSGRSVTVQQNYAAQRVWSEFFRTHQIELAIEIGTARGGFTAFLAEHVPRVESFDIVRHREFVSTPDVHFYQCDVFDYCQCTAQCALQERKLLICDGGNKPREIQTFTPYLNVSDFVAVHDYDIDRSTQRVRRCWGWCECQQSDIPYLYEWIEPVNGFGQTGWGVFEVVK